MAPWAGARLSACAASPRCRRPNAAWGGARRNSPPPPPAPSRHPRPGFPLSTLDIVGDNTAGSLELSYPLIRSREQNLTGALRLGARQSETRSFGAVLSSDHVRSVALGATYDAIDSWRGINLAF